MKRATALLLLVVLLLAGCAKKAITVDPQAKTISDGKYTYTYTDTTNINQGTVRTIRIKYPNGYTYIWEESKSEKFSSIGYDDYGIFENKYTPGDELVNAILEQELELQEEKEPYRILWSAVLAGAGLIALGIWMIAKPCPEPKSDSGANALTWTMVCGYAELGLGIIAVLMGFLT